MESNILAIILWTSFAFNLNPVQGAEDFTYQDEFYDYIEPDFEEDDHFGIKLSNTSYDRSYPLRKGLGNLNFKLGDPDLIRYLLPLDYDKMIQDPNSHDVSISLDIVDIIAITSYLRAENQLFHAVGYIHIEWTDTRIKDFNDYLDDMKDIYPEKVLFETVGKWPLS